MIFSPTPQQWQTWSAPAWLATFPNGRQPVLYTHAHQGAHMALRSWCQFPRWAPKAPYHPPHTPWPGMDSPAWCQFGVGRSRWAAASFLLSHHQAHRHTHRNTHMHNHVKLCAQGMFPNCLLELKYNLPYFASSRLLEYVFLFLLFLTVSE